MVALRRTIASARITLAALAVLAAVAALAACATPQNGATPTDAPLNGGTRSGDAGATSEPGDGRPYDCNGRPVDPVAFVAARPAATLPAEQLAIVENAVDDAMVPLGIDVNEWIVVATSGEQIDLMRRLDEDDRRLDPAHGWRHIVIGVLGSAGWMLMSSTTCQLAYDLSPLAAADIALDPANPPDPSSPQVALLVTERACNGGQDAQGRVVLVALVEMADTVRVVIGVDRSDRDGVYTCPSNPPTPFTVTLAAPLGGRALLNGNLVDEPPLTVAQT